MYSFNVGSYADLKLVNYGYIYWDDLAPKRVTRAKYSVGRDVVQLIGFSPRRLASNRRADHVAVAVDTVTQHYASSWLHIEEKTLDVENSCR